MSSGRIHRTACQTNNSVFIQNKFKFKADTNALVLSAETFQRKLSRNSGACPGQTTATCQRNILQHGWVQHVGRVWPTCCDMLRRHGWVLLAQNLNIFKFEPTTPNLSQHGGQTMLQCCVDMLRPFGRGFYTERILFAHSPVTSYYLRGFRAVFFRVLHGGLSERGTTRSLHYGVLL